MNKGRIGWAVSLFFCATLAAAQNEIWRYGFRSGDHLTYRYTFQKHTQSDDGESEVAVRFRSHVVVAGENGGIAAVGFQRNRESAELTLSRRNGKDRLAKDRIDFDKRMRTRQSRFSEGQEISGNGEPRYSWEMARETYSHILGAFHEITSLPPVALKKGEAWRANSALGLDLRWTDDETLHGKLCHRVEGTTGDGSVKLSYWWSPQSMVLEQVAIDGTYPIAGASVHEIARMELETLAHGESIDTWLKSPDTRLGALQTLLLSRNVAVTSEQLESLLSSNDPAGQALTLAVALRRELPLAASSIGQLKQASSSLLKSLSEEQSESKQTSKAGECDQPLPAEPAPAKFGTVLQKVAATKSEPEIPYLLRVPLTYRPDRPAPLLVYLSGGAGFAIDGVNTAEEAIAQTDYLVLYPNAGQYWWTPEMARRFDAVFQNVAANYNIDFDRVYLTGFSNGGTGSVYFAELWPQRFAAVVSLMGAGQCMDSVKAGLANLGNLPMLFVHGDKDPRIASDCSTTTVNALRDMHLPLKPELKILSGREHDITLQSDDGLTLAYFENKVRNPFPREIMASLSDAQAARQYWIEIVDGKLGRAEVEARVKPDNTVEIHSHDVKRLRVHLRPEMFPRPGEMTVRWNGKQLDSGIVKEVCQMPPAGADSKLDRSDVRDLSLP